MDEIWQEARKSFAERWVEAGGAGKYVVCNRTDGLGERLRALCNALAIAEFLGLGFKFSWPAGMKDHPQFHAVRPADMTFAADFVAAHQVEIAPGDFSELTKARYTPDALRELAAQSPRGLLVQRDDIREIMDVKAQPDWRQRFRRAFDSLPFCDGAQNAKAHALTLDMPANCVAIHLRAGDIVFGEHRFRNLYSNKVVTYPVAKRLIGYLVEQGKYPLIFGQDSVTCNLLAQRFGVRTATDWLGMPDTDALEAAIADIVLMSRCERILAGNSGFALLAASLSGAVHDNPANLLPPAQTVELIMGDDEIDDTAVALPDLQRAFAFFTAYRLAAKTASSEEKLHMLGRAIHYDRHNAFYRITKACEYIAAGRWKMAESEIERLFQTSYPPRGAMTASELYHMLPPGKARIAEMAPLMKTINRLAARPDAPFANFLLAMTATIQRDPAAADFVARSPAADPANPYYKTLPPGLRQPGL